MKVRLNPNTFSLLIVLLLSTYSYAAQVPQVPWPSEEVLGDLHTLVSETHKAQLIKESLEEKYVSGVSYPLSFVYQHSFVSLDKDGSQIIYYDSAVRINTPEAKQRMGEEASRFNSEKETLDYLTVVVYLKDGKQIDTDVTTTRIKEPFTGLVYSDLKVKTLTIQGLEEGSAGRSPCSWRRKVRRWWSMISGVGKTGLAESPKLRTMWSRRSKTPKARPHPIMIP